MSLLHCRLGSVVLSLGWLIGTASHVDAQEYLITVTFSGTGTGASAGSTFDGVFTYNQSHAVASSTAGLFIFQGIGELEHSICYTIGTAPRVCGSQTGCDPFRITTSGGSKKTFGLTTTVAGKTVIISLPTGSILDQRHLPYAGTFPNPPLAGSTFQVKSGTTVVFTGTITALISSEAEIARAPASYPPPCSYGDYNAPAPYPIESYVCQPQPICEPRPGCCLSRLFARRSHRICGR